MSTPEPTPEPVPRRTPARVLVAGAAVVLVLAGAASLRTLQGLTNPIDLFNRVLLSPDELFPETLYADLVSGVYDVRAFQFSAATFAVPDIAVYAGVRAITGSARRSILIWAATFY